MKKVTVYLVRHGQADSNKESILTSYPEVRPMHLTHSGREKIVALKEFFRDKDIAAVIASPLTRTRETAEILADGLGLSVQTDVRLRETDFGMYNNHPAEEFFRQYPDPRMRITNTHKDRVEAFVDVRTRVRDFLQDILQAYDRQEVLVVSHGDTIGEILGIARHQSLGESVWAPMPEKGECISIEITDEILSPGAPQPAGTE